jgi:hypothetical protein
MMGRRRAVRPGDTRNSGEQSRWIGIPRTDDTLFEQAESLDGDDIPGVTGPIDRRPHLRTGRAVDVDATVAALPVVQCVALAVGQPRRFVVDETHRHMLDETESRSDRFRITRTEAESVAWDSNRATGIEH